MDALCNAEVDVEIVPGKYKAIVSVSAQEDLTLFLRSNPCQHTTGTYLCNIFIS